MSHSAGYPAKGIKLIVGLGNPGPQYAATRHNAGAWFIERLCEENRIPLLPELKLKGALTTLPGSNGSPPCKILQPSTYINCSGEPIQLTLHFFKIVSTQMLVVHDDLDLPPGTIRLKREGGHGGHNGLRDIISHIGAHFYRLRIGIGHPGEKEDVVNYVLKKPSVSDRKKIDLAIEQGLTVLPHILKEETEKAMNILHTIT